MSVHVSVWRLRALLLTARRRSWRSRHNWSVACLGCLVVRQSCGVILESVLAWPSATRSGLRRSNGSRSSPSRSNMRCALWVAVEHSLSIAAPRRARLKYVLSGMGFVDLIAILPSGLCFLCDRSPVVLLLACHAFFKLMRYSPGNELAPDALYASAGPVQLRRHSYGVTLFAASLMHLVEDVRSPISSAPFRMPCVGVVTLGTVGYGDAVPVTSLDA